MASGEVGPPRDPLATEDSLPTLGGAGRPLARVPRLVVGVGLSLILIIVMIGALVLALQNTFRVAV